MSIARQPEAVLRKRERRFRLALAAAKGEAWTWDLDTDQLEIESVGGDSGASPPVLAVARMAVLSLVHPADRTRLEAAMSRTRKPHGDDGWDLEYRVILSDGRTGWRHSVAFVERAADGRALDVSGVSLDVTDLKAAAEDAERSHEALRLRADALARQTAQLRRLASELTLAEQRTREQLARTLHDDLQQLLFSAKMKLDRLAGGSSDASLLERATSDLEEAIAASRSLSLELFPPALRDSHLEEALTWLAAWMERKYGLHVHVTASPGAHIRQTDVRTLVFESVRELLFNVVKHAGVDHASIEVVETPRGELSITVEDRGGGFDVAALRAPGPAGPHGLGLISIRERVALLGGSFEVESTPGQGSLFRIVTPRTVDAPAGAEPSAAEPRPRRPLRILIADDHAVVRAGLRELFSARPELTVVGEAADGMEAIVQAHLLRPDVVVMDVSMPLLDGIEATMRLRAELPEVRVFGLSTQEQREGRHAIERAGADGYFTKGENVHDLVERLLAVHAGQGGGKPGTS